MFLNAVGWVLLVLNVTACIGPVFDSSRMCLACIRLQRYVLDLYLTADVFFTVAECVQADLYLTAAGCTGLFGLRPNVFDLQLTCV